MEIFAACNRWWRTFMNLISRTLLLNGLLYPFRNNNTLKNQLGNTHTRQLIPSVALLKGQSGCKPYSDTCLNDCIELYGNLEGEFEGSLRLGFDFYSGNYNVHWWECQNSENYGDDLKLFLRDIELRLSAIQLQTLFPYSQNHSKDKLVRLVENEEQAINGTIEMLRVLALIYEFYFNRAGNNTYFKNETQSSDIKLEDIFNFIFCVNPSAMKYVGRILKCRIRPSVNKRLKKHFEIFNECIRQSERNWLTCGKVFKAPLSLSELFKFDYLNLWLENETCKDLWIRYNALYKEVYKTVDKLKEDKLLDLKKSFNMYKNRTFKLYNEFIYLYEEKKHKINEYNNDVEKRKEIDSRQMLVDVESLDFVHNCAKNLLGTCEMLSKISKYEVKDINMDKSFGEMFWTSIKKSIKRTTKYKKAVIWNAGYLNFDLYIWETALLIETDVKASPIICKYLKEQLKSGNNSFYDRFINNYTSAFPGLLKSICDMSPTYDMANTKLSDINRSVCKITAQNCRPHDLMNLYYLIKHYEDTNPVVCDQNMKEFFWNVEYNTFAICTRLINQNIASFKDIREKKSKTSIIDMYILQIVGYEKPGTSKDGSSLKSIIFTFVGSDFSAKFRKLKFIEQNLAIFIEICKEE